MAVYDCFAKVEKLKDYIHLKTGWIERDDVYSESDIRTDIERSILVDRCEVLIPREATKDELLLAHKNVSEKENKEIFFAIGSIIELIKSLCNNEIRNGIFVNRSLADDSYLKYDKSESNFNKIAIATEYALRYHNKKKILILDFDDFVDDKIEQECNEDNGILYISIRGLENSESYETNFSYHEDEFSYFVPISEFCLADCDFIYVFHNVILPLAYEFYPDLILVNMGSIQKLLSSKLFMNSTSFPFHYMISSLKNFANGKICVMLEEDVHIREFSNLTKWITKALLGDPIMRPDNANNDINKSVIKNTHKIMSTLGINWKYFKQFRENFLNKSEMENIMDNLSDLEIENKYYSEILDLVNVENINLGLKKQITEYKTGYVYSVKMLKHKSKTSSCLEKPKRLESIISRLNEFGLTMKCLPIEGSFATPEQLELVHDKDYVAKVKRVSINSEDAREAQKIWDSIYCNEYTYDNACFAAGSLINLTDVVMNNIVENGLGLIRPPGHHAEKDSAGGFCFFNNVAVAAKYAVEKYGLKKVAIVDFDVHWGNGTQHIFYDDPKVLYISVHRYNNARFYPMSKEADSSFTGIGNAQGFNVNIPLDSPKPNEVDYIYVFRHIILPILYEFNAELVFISCGLDACSGDPLGKCDLAPEVFGHFVSMIKNLTTEHKLIVALEGGYNLNAISLAMVTVLHALLDYAIIPIDMTKTPNSSTLTTIKSIAKLQSKYWKHLSSYSSLFKN